MSLFRQMKASQLPNVISMSEAERKAAVQEVQMDRYDILGFLNGQELLLIEGELEELEVCDYGEILAGLELHQQQIKEQGGVDEDIRLYQREGKFDAFANEAAKLVGELGADISKVRKMPEKVLRQWLIEYIHCLAVGKRKTEGTITGRSFHQGIGW